MKNALLDKDFLLTLDSTKQKTIYGKIIAFDNQGIVLNEITGQVNSGSISVDGKSAVRRSCNLSLTYNTEVSVQWALMNRFKLYIGVQNEINPEYEPIIWFPQGYYIATSYSCSKNLNSISISLQGKDKMCLLNGDVSGNIPYGITINKYRDVENDKDKELTIREMIYYLVSEIGREEIYNIIINDLPDYALELIKNNSDKDLFVRVENSNTSAHYTALYEQIPSNVYVQQNGKIMSYKSNMVPSIKYYQVDGNNTNTTKFYDALSGSDYHYYYRVLPGATCGYRETPLVWPASQGDLVLKAGDNIASALTKIFQVFGNYEFFYDVDGRLIIQQQKVYTQMSFSGDMTSGGLAGQTQYEYKFTNENLIQTISNQPKVNNIKNDFSIWGKRLDASDFCLRYAIDNKPTSYYSQLQKRTYKVADGVDWRELIYLMAADFYNESSNIKYAAKTGYEQYYADLYRFWYYDDGLTTTKLTDIPIYDRPYWIDFLDAGDSELGRYNISSIGDRVKSLTDDKIHAIAYDDVPYILFMKAGDSQHIAGYDPIQLTDQLLSYLDISSQGQTAYNKLNELLYQHTYTNASVSIKAIPIYYLTPNTLIYLYDKELNIKGDYKIDKITYQFSYNGLMDITAVEVPKQLY